MSRLDPSLFYTDEEHAIEEFAQAIGAMYEAISLVGQTFEDQGFADSVRLDFGKQLKRLVTAISSAVPNQYNEKVAKAMQDYLVQNGHGAIDPAAPEQPHAEPAATPVEQPPTDST